MRRKAGERSVKGHRKEIPAEERLLGFSVEISGKPPSGRSLKPAKEGTGQKKPRRPHIVFLRRLITQTKNIPYRRRDPWKGKKKLSKLKDTGGNRKKRSMQEAKCLSGSSGRTEKVSRQQIVRKIKKEKGKEKILRKK